MQKETIAEEDYVVEGIVDVRMRLGEKQYRVKWLGYSS